MEKDPKFCMIEYSGEESQVIAIKCNIIIWLA